MIRYATFAQDRARRLRRAIAAAALVAASLPATAQSPEPYPSRPVKILVPYAPGGATDIIARHLATRLNDVLAQSVVVENRAGASGNIALEAAAKAPPDGYTLLCGNVSTNAITPARAGIPSSARIDARASGATLRTRSSSTPLYTTRKRSRAT